jgi:hypothetical protein
MASRDALPKTSPTLAFRKDFVILGLFLRASSSGWGGKTNKAFFNDRQSGALEAAFCSSVPWCLGFIPGLRRIGKSEDRGAIRVRSG